MHAKPSAKALELHAKARGNRIGYVSSPCEIRPSLRLATSRDRFYADSFSVQHAARQTMHASHVDMQQTQVH